MVKVVHCKQAKFDVYIGRRHSDFPTGSIFANPFIIGKDGTRAEVIKKYEQHLRSRHDLLDKILELDGKTLGCWCKPKACHGDVLVKIVNELSVSRRFFEF